MLDPVFSDPCFPHVLHVQKVSHSVAMTDFKIALHPILIMGSPSHFDKEYSVPK